MLLALLLLTLPTDPTPPSILLVTLDDVGAEQLRAYDPAAPACTPFLDEMAAAGMVFTRAYSQTVCSPTRASWLTGRHPFRTGVGSAVRYDRVAQEQGLDPDEYTLSDHLGSHGYATWTAGKWHLNGITETHDHPGRLGVSEYRGDLAGAPGFNSGPANYSDWDYTVNGTTTVRTDYITTRTAIDAMVLSYTQGPWFGAVHFNAPHSPYHVPPLMPCYSGCPCPSPGGTGNSTYPSMIQSVDAFVRAVVEEAVRATAGNLVVILWGDNGTPTQVPANPSCPRSGKGFLFEGGVRVPLIVAGEGISTGTTDALVGPTDLFDTVCELAGVPLTPLAMDSASFLPALQGGPGTRSSLYLGYFEDNGNTTGPWNAHRRSVIEDRYKLIRRYPQQTLPAEEMLDLQCDPCEAVNLLESTLNPFQQAAYDRMKAQLTLLGVD